jgi:hypothetical protein
MANVSAGATKAVTPFVGTESRRAKASYSLSPKARRTSPVVLVVLVRRVSAFNSSLEPCAF